MTLATTTPRTSVTGTGAVITVPVDFQFFAAADLVVIERTIATGAEAVKLLGTDYTVAGGDGATGSVTSVAAVAAALEWHVRRATDRAQSADYPAGGTFPAATHEEVLDRLAAQVQELDATLAQALRFPRSDAIARVAQFAASVARANKVAAFDANGDVTLTDLSASIASTTLIVVSGVDPGHSTGRLWIDTSVANTLIIKQSDGADWIEIWRVNTTTNALTVAGAAMLALANVLAADQEIKSTTAGAGEGPTLTLNRDQAGADGDLLGVLKFAAKDDGGGVESVAKIRAKWVDSGAGSEDSAQEFETLVNGVAAVGMTLAQGLTMKNATGGDPGAGKVNAQDLQINGQSISALLAEKGGARNLVLNSNFDLWQRYGDVSISVSSPAGNRTFTADRFYVNPSGAAVTQRKSIGIKAPDTRSTDSLEVTGAGGVTTVLIGTRLEANNRHATTLTFAAYIYNNTGAAFTPSLLVGTPNSENDFTTVVNRLTQTLPNCADASWTRVTHSFNAGAFTNIDKGLQVELQIPNGVMGGASDVVKIAQFQLAQENSFGGFEPPDPALELARCQRFYWKSFDHQVTPAQNAGLTGAVRAIASAAGAVTQRFFGRLPVPMQPRTGPNSVPTFTTYNPAAANAQVRNVTDGADLSATAISGDANQFIVTATGTAGTAVGEELAVHVTADAEL